MDQKYKNVVFMIILLISFDLLLVSGGLSGVLADADEIIARVKPGKASIIKVVQAYRVITGLI